MITTRDIQQLVCKKFEISMDDLRGIDTTRRFAVPRQIAMYLARSITNESWGELGRVFCKDHSSVCWAFDRVSERMGQDPRFTAIIQELLHDLQMPGGVPAPVLPEPKPLHSRNMEIAMRTAWRKQAKLTRVSGSAI